MQVSHTNSVRSVGVWSFFTSIRSSLHALTLKSGCRIWRGSTWGRPLLTLVLLALWAVPSAAQPETMPSATLERVDGSSVQLRNIAGENGTVLVFWSNQCPWVDRYEERVQTLVERFQGQGVRFILVNANDASSFPQESLAASRERADRYDATYVRDNEASLARELDASRTPHVFVYDASRTLVYTGAIDDSPSDPSNVSETYLADALTALINGEEVPVAQTKAFGCTIKFPN